MKSSVPCSRHLYVVFPLTRTTAKSTEIPRIKYILRSTKSCFLVYFIKVQSGFILYYNVKMDKTGRHVIHLRYELKIWYLHMKFFYIYNYYYTKS